MSVGLDAGRVTMLIAESDAAGTTPRSVQVGVSWFTLQTLVGPLDYDEEEGLWCTESEPGIWYEIARPALPGETPLEPPLVPEQYEVADPASAVVRRVFVM